MTSETTNLARVTVAEIPSLVGVTFGPSPWREITQQQVNEFADLTEDHNPIHVDPAFAQATPFGGTIVHGYFTLSLIVPLMADYFEVTDMATGINYGLDKLRFPAPVAVGSKIRATSTVTGTTEIAGGIQAHVTTSIEVEGASKPAVVAEMLLRYYA